MKREEMLSLEEFVTAARKAPIAPGSPDNAALPTQAPPENLPDRLEMRALPETRTDAHKALRQLKSQRMRGVHNFVNVHLDRETKRRLKLASFNTETSMQALMETAIRRYLDETGF